MAIHALSFVLGVWRVLQLAGQNLELTQLKVGQLTEEHLWLRSVWLQIDRIRVAGSALFTGRQSEFAGATAKSFEPIEHPSRIVISEPDC